MDDKPEPGKQYALTGPGPSIANGNTWAESEVPSDRDCEQCGSYMGPVERMLGPVCGTCCRENHKRVSGGA